MRGMQLSKAKAIEVYPGRKRLSKFLISSLFVLFFALLVVWAGWNIWQADQALDANAQPQTIEIGGGVGARAIGQQLSTAGVVRNTHVFVLAVLLDGARGKLQAGKYELSASMSAKDIARLLRDG